MGCTGGSSDFPQAARTAIASTIPNILMVFPSYLWRSCGKDRRRKVVSSFESSTVKLTHRQVVSGLPVRVYLVEQRGRQGFGFHRSSSPGNSGAGLFRTALSTYGGTARRSAASPVETATGRDALALQSFSHLDSVSRHTFDRAWFSGGLVLSSMRSDVWTTPKSGQPGAPRGTWATLRVAVCALANTSPTWLT